jgi:hypothetical protein
LKIALYKQPGFSADRLDFEELKDQFDGNILTVFHSISKIVDTFHILTSRPYLCGKFQKANDPGMHQIFIGSGFQPIHNIFF